MRKIVVLLIVVMFLPLVMKGQKYALQRSLVFDGVSFDNEPVQLPYIFLDVLRNETDGWLVEKGGAGFWEYEEKEICTKFNNGRFKELRALKWDGVSWKTQYLSQYSYSIQNNPYANVVTINDYNKLKNPNDTIRKQYKLIRSPSLLVKEKQNQFFFGSIPSTDSRNIYKYDNKNRLIYDSTLNFPFNSINCYKYKTYRYDNNNNCIEKTEYRRDNLNDAFDTLNLYVYTYDKHNRLITNTLYRSESQTNNLSMYSFYEYGYSELGHVNEEIFHLKNQSLGSVTPYIWYKSYYDSIKRLQSLTLRLNLNGNSWQYLDSIVISYKANGEFDTSYLYKGLKNINKWQWSNRSFYRYIFDGTSTLSTPKITNTIKKFNVYPNPTQDRISIEAEIKNGVKSLPVEIIDILGKQVYLGAIPVVDNSIKEEVNIAHLPAGIYLIRIGETSKKLIKE